MTAEELARFIHQTNKELLEQGNTIIPQTRPWIEWEDLPENIKKARIEQAKKIYRRVMDFLDHKP